MPLQGMSLCVFGKVCYCWACYCLHVFNNNYVIARHIIVYLFVNMCVIACKHVCHFRAHDCVYIHLSVSHCKEWLYGINLFINICVIAWLYVFINSNVRISVYSLGFMGCVYSLANNKVYVFINRIFGCLCVYIYITMYAIEE